MSNPSSPPRYPAPISGAHRLRDLYGRPGPFVSVYLATGSGSVATDTMSDDAPEATDGRWKILRSQLEGEGAQADVLDAIGAQLALPAPDDAAAVVALAAADGTTIVDYGLEPPRADVACFDTLPYVGPFLEWDQRRVPHLVVAIDDAGADVAVFGPDHRNRIESLDGQPGQLATAITELAEAAHSRLVIVTGQPFVTRRLTTDLATTLPIDCRVVAETDVSDLDDLTDRAVRHVSDAVARRTVGLLRELRFLATHQSAVDGIERTLASLRSGTADVLLIHDSPDDDRRAWITEDPRDLSTEEPSGGGVDARLVDAVIRAAVLSETHVHIIPTTGPNGPADNTAVLQRGTTSSIAALGEISGI